MRLLAYQEEAGISLEEQLDGRFDLGRLRELYFERLGPNESMIPLRHPAARPRFAHRAVDQQRARVGAAVAGQAAAARPDPRAGHRSQVNAVAGECLFVDDLEVNCETARALGMTAVRFETAEQAIAELDSAFSQ
jgi:hypothetical protein